MENRVGDFVAGIEATFGRFSRSTEELAGFLKSAERFYLDYSGIPRHYEANEENDIPFWRYLIYYSTLALDHAAAAGGDASSDEDEDGEYNQAARELASCWPLLSVLVSSQYASVKSAAPAQTLPSPKKHGSREDMDMPPFPATSGSTLRFMSPPKVDKAIQTDDNGDDILSHPRPDMHRHPSIMRA